MWTLEHEELFAAANACVDSEESEWKQWRKVRQPLVDREGGLSSDEMLSLILAEVAMQGILTRRILRDALARHDG